MTEAPQGADPMRMVLTSAKDSTVTLLHPSGRSWSIDWDWCEGACVEGDR